VAWQSIWQILKHNVLPPALGNRDTWLVVPEASVGADSLDPIGQDTGFSYLQVGKGVLLRAFTRFESHRLKPNCL